VEGVGTPNFLLPGFVALLGALSPRDVLDALKDFLISMTVGFQPISQPINFFGGHFVIHVPFYLLPGIYFPPLWS
jgi:hypothetical protein